MRRNPGERLPRPRLEIAFGVNADRWLIATVRDLLSQRELMREEPVLAAWRYGLGRAAAFTSDASAIPARR